MANDPAFLFYSNDFDCATKFFTHEQVGKYMRLLIAQHQHGPLTLEQANFLAGPLDQVLLSKFKTTNEGLLYNNRLSEEMVKREKFTKSRRINGLAKKQSISNRSTSEALASHMDKHMENENENENENRNEVKNVNYKWIEELEKDPKYTRIDICTEVEKMREWIQERPHVPLTKSFAMRWLNKITTNQVTGEPNHGTNQRRKPRSNSEALYFKKTGKYFDDPEGDGDFGVELLQAGMVATKN